MIRISEAERQVMEVVWREGEAGAETLFVKVGEPNGWAEATTRTLIARLLGKKALSSTRDGGRVLYRPLIDRTQYLRSESQGLLDRLFEGELGTMVAHFAHTKALTPRDIETMKRLLSEIENDG